MIYVFNALLIGGTEYTLIEEMKLKRFSGILKSQFFDLLPSHYSTRNQNGSQYTINFKKLIYIQKVSVVITLNL